MKQFFALALCSAVLAFAPAHAASPAQKAQQEKMSQCNKDAGDKKGDERKAFMKDCLSAKPAAKTSQQDKMKACNAEAVGKKGDERKKFMSECLKG
ncbi:MAG: PsiF family protein [Burkholderiaceae bacterium]